MSDLTERLDDVAEGVARIEGILSSMPCQMHMRRLDELDKQIRGNGAPGVKLRLDRLEQRGSVKDRLLWAMVGTFITAFGAVCVSLIT